MDYQKRVNRHGQFLPEFIETTDCSNPGASIKIETAQCNIRGTWHFGYDVHLAGNRLARIGRGSCRRDNPFPTREGAYQAARAEIIEWLSGFDAWLGSDDPRLPFARTALSRLIQPTLFDLVG